MNNWIKFRTKLLCTYLEIIKQSIIVWIFSKFQQKMTLCFADCIIRSSHIIFIEKIEQRIKILFLVNESGKDFDDSINLPHNVKLYYPKINDVLVVAANGKYFHFRASSILHEYWFWALESCCCCSSKSPWNFHEIEKPKSCPIIITFLFNVVVFWVLECSHFWQCRMIRLIFN